MIPPGGVVRPLTNDTTGDDREGGLKRRPGRPCLPSSLRRGRLPDGLTSIQQVEYTVLSCDFAYLSGRIDQPTVGGNMRDGDQFDPFIDSFSQCL